MTFSHTVPHLLTDAQARKSGVDYLRELGLDLPMILWVMTVPCSCSRIQRGGRVVLGGGNPPPHCRQGSSIAGHRGVLRFVAVAHLFLQVHSKMHR